MAQKKETRVQWPRERLQKCQSDASKHVYENETGYESGTYGYEPDIEQ